MSPGDGAYRRVRGLAAMADRVILLSDRHVASVESSTVKRNPRDLAW